MHLEEVSRQFYQEESDKKRNYKSKMQTMTESDRLQRLDWQEKHKKPSCPSEASQNMITKLFERQPHASHNLRARNDKVTAYITEKW